MVSTTLHVQRLWALRDGTVCLLVEREEAPRYEICVVRGEDVIRQYRLYARGSAQMLAETWLAALGQVHRSDLPAEDQRSAIVRENASQRPTTND